MNFARRNLLPAAPRPPEVRLHLAANVAREGYRLTVSEGLVAANSQTAPNYAPDAFIPKLPFFPLDANDMSVLTESDITARSQTLGVFKVSDRLLEALRKPAREEAPDLKHLIQDLCAELPSSWRVSTPPSRLAIGRNPAGLQTVTRDPFTGAYVGLHVDTFEAPYDPVRDNAGNRISVNIGLDTRFLLLIPLAFKSLWSSTAAPHTSVVTHFLRTHPEQRVLSLAVHPGEAYIAPTESLIHDASSLSMGSADLHVTGRGVFEPCLQ